MILSLEGINFAYKEDEPIFSNLSLSFLDNQATAIVGQNGAGKTTLVKLLKGLLRPQQGSIYYESTDLASLSVAQIAQYIGLVFQNPDDQIFKQDVLSEVMYGPLNIGFSQEQAKKAAISALKAVGLDGMQESNPYDLSLAQRKLIAIAAIIAMDPQVIIFDEPTIGQDAKGKERIKDIIGGLKAQGKLVITIIHDMDFVVENFERTVIFAQGKVLADGPTQSVFQKTAILKKAHLQQPYIMLTTKALGYGDAFTTVADFVQFYRKQAKK